MYAVIIYFFTFSMSEELCIFFKKRDDHGFLSYQVLFICKKIVADDDAYLFWGWSKIRLFRINELIFL